MTGKNVKLSILEKGSQIVHKKGFNNTGIKEILDAASVPKGSFYHYFKNKEDFGLNLLDFFAGFFVGKAQGLMNDTDSPPVQRLKRLFDEFLSFFEDKGYKMGCPIGNLSQEMGDLNTAFREKLEEIFRMMRTPIENMLNEAKQRGEISDLLDARDTADFIINSWEGAILRMKVLKNPDPLVLFDKMIFEGILKQ